VPTQHAACRRTAHRTACRRDACRRKDRIACRRISPHRVPPHGATHRPAVTSRCVVEFVLDTVRVSAG